MPHVDSIRIDIEQNRDLELLRFRRGELQLDRQADAGSVRPAGEPMRPGRAVDAGPTLDSEFLWFNQAQRAPLRDAGAAMVPIAAFPARDFAGDPSRRSVPRGLSRPCEPGGRSGVAARTSCGSSSGLAPEPFDPDGRAEAARQRTDSGCKAATLRDRAGNAVEFSVVTNAGSKTRERMAAMIQQDLAKLGIQARTS